MEKAAAIAECHGKRFFIEMFSHRWCSSEAPDDRSNAKATVLVQWAKYRWSCGLATFFWVDYACIDQNNIAPGVCMLPLYVSSCNNIVCYDTPEYGARAWCRVERLLFTAFVAPNSEFVSQDFVFDPSAERLANNELMPQQEDSAVLPDPEEGDLSHQEDYVIIQELKSLCSEHWAKCWKDGLMQAVEGKLEGIGSLQFGSTRVRLRRFSSNAQEQPFDFRRPSKGTEPEHCFGDVDGSVHADAEFALEIDHGKVEASARMLPPKQPRGAAPHWTARAGFSCCAACKEEEEGEDLGHHTSHTRRVFGQASAETFSGKRMENVKVCGLEGGGLRTVVGAR